MAEVEVDEVTEKKSKHEKVAWLHPKPHDKGGTLLSRLGGVDVVRDFTYGFYDRMLEDHHIGTYLKKWMPPGPADMFMTILKDRTVEYLEVVWDNEDWEGQDLFAAHAHLHMSQDMYNRACKCAQWKLNKMKISANLRKEVMKEMEVMRDPITDPHGKFHDWIIKKNTELQKQSLKNEDMVTDAMGFGMSRQMMDAMADKARKEQERKEKMKALAEQRKATQSASKLVKADAKAAPEKPTDKIKDSKSKAKVDEAGKGEVVAKTKSKSEGKAKSKAKAKEASAKALPKKENVPELPPEENPAWVPESVAPCGFLVRVTEPEGSCLACV